MFIQRLLSGAVLLALMLFLLARGGVFLLLACYGVSLVGQYELYKALGIEHKDLGIAGYLMTSIYYILVWMEGRAYMTAMIVGALLLFMTIYVVTFPKHHVEQVTAAFFGMCYVSVLMSFVYLTRSGYDGKYMVWLILISSWGSDTLAYCTGMLVGKTKMFPILSPKKTWEGAAGGVIGAGLLGALYGLILGSRMNDALRPVLICMTASALGAVISMLGDLAASAIKRNRGIKDYGRLIPGHGGVLDRFDSMLFTAPVIYYTVNLFVQSIQ